MSNARPAVVVIASSLLVLAAKGADQPRVSFYKDVAPILYKHCASCHRSGDVAPMSLLTYEEARPWASAIREAVLNRTMPPWHADSTYGVFANDSRLEEGDIETLARWAKEHAPAGDPVDAPPLPVFQDRWHVTPDVVLSIPKEYRVLPAKVDEYAYIYVPTNFTEDKWIQTAEVLPGDRRVVHHATVSVVKPNELPEEFSSGEARRGRSDKYRHSTGAVLHIRPDVKVIDDGCAVPGGGALPGEDPEPGDFVSIYLPGHVPEVRPAGYAIKIPAGAVLQFQIHYSNRTGQEIADRTSLGLVFAKAPVIHRIRQYEIWNNTFEIPPRDPGHRVTSCFTLDQDVLALAYTGHMHYRGKSIETEAVFPDGRTEVLFSVPKYDFRWQETYMLKAPRLLPKGTRLMTTAYFDNSANNPLNPNPDRRIRWGEPSDEEMMGFWLAFTDTSPDR